MYAGYELPTPKAPIACVADFSVVAESDNWIVVDKAAPLIVHPSNAKKEPNLLQGLRRLLCYEVVNGAELALVNRLDRETSGLTLVAKSKYATRKLGCAMQDRKMHKEYLAIVQGHPAWQETLCEAPVTNLRDVAKSRIYVKQTVHPDGKPCKTEFRIEKTWQAECGKLALVRCIPHTGRMHQLRVHLAHLGHPILGDKIYGPSEDCYLEFVEFGWTPNLERQLILPRHALHACKLTFPYDEVEYTAEADLPADMRALIK